MINYFVVCFGEHSSSKARSQADKHHQMCRPPTGERMNYSDGKQQEKLSKKSHELPFVLLALMYRKTSPLDDFAKVSGVY